MSTHLYCVLPAGRQGVIPPGLTGLGGGMVRPLGVSSFVAWVSDIDARDKASAIPDRARAPSLIDGVRIHDGVVEAALETGSTPLPARFGQRFETDDACRSALAGRAAAVESLLAAVQGHVEMTLIITPSTRRMLRELQPVLPELADDAARGRHEGAGTDAQGAGRRYLESLRAREAATGAVRRAIDELEHRLALAARPFTRRTAAHEQLAKTPPLRTLSHLVPREAVDRYKAAVGAVPPGEEFRFLVIGPRAPYSFCELEPGRGTGGTHGMKLAD